MALLVTVVAMAVVLDIDVGATPAPLGGMGATGPCTLLTAPHPCTGHPLLEGGLGMVPLDPRMAEVDLHMGTPHRPLGEVATTDDTRLNHTLNFVLPFLCGLAH